MADNDLSDAENCVMIAPGHELYKSKFLIVDDEEPSVRLLERILRRAQFENLTSTTEPCEAVSLFDQFQPDLVLTDLLMPRLSGLAVVEQLRDRISPVDYLPIVVLTADVTQGARRRALAAGATDFLTKPFDVVEVLLRIGNLLQARHAHLRICEQNATLGSTWHDGPPRRPRFYQYAGPYYKLWRRTAA